MTGRVGLAILALFLLRNLFHEEDIADLLAQAEFEREQRDAAVRASRAPAIRAAIDVGSTFTRLLAVDQRSGERWTIGLPTSRGGDPSQTVAACLDRAGLRADRLELLVQGTTVAVPTEPENGGARAALIETAGAEPILSGSTLVPGELRFELHERMSADGCSVDGLDEAELGSVLTEAEGRGAQSIAFRFQNADRNPAHERRAVEIAAQRADLFVTAASELGQDYGEAERADAAVLNAVVAPGVIASIRGLEKMLSGRGFRGHLFLMRSDGSVDLAKAFTRLPVLALRSGPAGGDIAALRLGAQVGCDNLVTFDVGGSTAKIRVPGVAARLSDAAEIAVGGESIAWIDELGALRVGPRSAGAYPGPAAYGLGNDEPTVTDANIILGRIDATSFLGGEMTIHPELADQALERLGSRLGYDALKMAAGIVQLANLTMSAALRRVSIERGKDPRDFTLVAMGGNGPLHAAELAEELGTSSILIPRIPAHFSAVGMLLANARYDVRQAWTVELPNSGNHVEGLEQALEGLSKALSDVIAATLGPTDGLSFQDDVEMRYKGREATIRVHLRSRQPASDDAFDLAAFFTAMKEGRELVKPKAESPELYPEAIARLFHQAHRERFGHALPLPIEIVSLRVGCAAPLGTRLDASVPAGDRGRPNQARQVYSAQDGRMIPYAIMDRAGLRPGDVVEGPALVEEEATTTNVPAGWTALVLDDGALELRGDRVLNSASSQP